MDIDNRIVRSLVQSANEEYMLLNSPSAVVRQLIDRRPRAECCGRHVAEEVSRLLLCERISGLERRIDKLEGWRAIGITALLVLAVVAGFRIWFG